jgi:hypothetical protein
MRIPYIQKSDPEYKGSSAPMHGGRNEKSLNVATQDKKN